MGLCLTQVLSMENDDNDAQSTIGGPIAKLGTKVQVSQKDKFTHTWARIESLIVARLEEYNEILSLLGSDFKRVL